MAKTLLGPIVTDVRNKVGGTVFSAGPFGSTIRRKVSPVNPASVNQNGIRANLSSGSKRFTSVLTSVQQDAWTTFAAAHQVHDVFGNLITLTGLQIFSQVNGVLHTIGAAHLDSPPADLLVGSPGVLSFVASAGGPTLTINSSLAPAANEHPVVFDSGPVNAGRRFIKGKLRLLQVFGAAVAGPWDIRAVHEAKYGGLIQTQTFFIGVVFAKDTNGAQSPIVTIRVTVGP